MMKQRHIVVVGFVGLFVLAGSGVVAQTDLTTMLSAFLVELRDGTVTLPTTTGASFRRSMTTPADPTLATNQSGTDLAAGDYKVAIVGVDPAGGTSLPSAAITQTVGAGGAGRIVVTYVAPTGFASVRVYVTTMGGATPDRYFTSTSATTTNIDTLTGATVAALPSANTAYQFNVGGETANWFSLPSLFRAGNSSAPGIGFAKFPTTGFYTDNSAKIFFGTGGTARAILTGSPSPGEFQLKSDWVFSISSGAVEAASDIVLSRESAAVLQFGLDAAGVTAQTLKGPDRSTSDGVGGNLTIAAGRNRGASVGGSLLFQTSPAAVAGVTGTLATRLTIDSTGSLGLGALGVVFMSATAPTIASGGCTSPAVTSNNGTATFKVTLGTTCATVKTFTLTMPPATNYWACDAVDLTTNATYRPEQSAAASATSVVITNYARTTGLAIDFVDGEVLLVKCTGG